MKTFVVYYEGKSLHLLGYLFEVEANSKDEAIKIGFRNLFPKGLFPTDKGIVVDDRGNNLGLSLIHISEPTRPY